MTIHHNLPAADYFAIPGLRNSELNAMAKSPKHAKLFREQSQKNTKSLLVGSALHCLVLDDPATFYKLYAIRDFDLRKPKHMAEKDSLELAGLTILSSKEYAGIQAMRDALYEHPISGPLLRSLVYRELTVTDYNKHRNTTMAYQRKARLDGLTECLPGQLDILDIKSCLDASNDAFTRSCMKYGYYRQAPWYLELLRQNAHLLPQQYKISGRFYYLAVENHEPYSVNVFLVMDEMMEYGRAEFLRLQDQWAECSINNNWRSYDEVVNELGLPWWITNNRERRR